MNIFTKRHNELERYYPACNCNVRITKEEADNLIKKFERHATIAIYNLMYTNDFVSGYVNDVLQEFSKTNYCRFERKKIVRQIQKHRLEYERKIYSVAKDLAGFFGDTAERFIESSGVEEAVEVLFWSIKQVLDDNGVNDSLLIAKMDTARALLDVSTQQYNWRIKDLNELDPSFSLIKLDYLCLLDADKAMNRLMDTFAFEHSVNMNTKMVQVCIEYCFPPVR